MFKELIKQGKAISWEMLTKDEQITLIDVYESYMTSFVPAGLLKTLNDQHGVLQLVELVLTQPSINLNDLFAYR